MLTGSEAPAADPGALARDALRRAEAAGYRADRVRVVHAPGRVNLIGEHTDYNSGLVLPVAIDLGISIAFIPTHERRLDLTLRASGERAVIPLDEERPMDGTWADYPAGIAWVLREAGVPTRGVAGVLQADLPIGAGLSSSAALELVTALALGAGEAPDVDRLRLAQLAQRAENEYVGVPCGLMDQFTVSFGVADAALLLDCRSLEHRVVPFPDGVRIVVVDSGIQRRLAASGYSARRAECDRAVAQIRATAAVETLRDVDADLLERARPSMDPVAYRRARHLVTENHRVVEAAAALEAGDLATIGRVFAASHASLRDDFEVSIPELDRLVELAASTPGVVGSRLTGAGFGGCTVNLVAPEAVDELKDRLAGVRLARDAAPVRVYDVRPSAGAREIWSGAA